MLKDEDLVVEEEIVLDNEQEEETIEESEVSNESEEPATIQDEDEEDEEDRIVTIGDTPPEEEEGEKPETPGWVKKVRKVNRKLESEVKQLKRQLEEKQKAAENERPVELGEEPTLSGSGYDDVKYKQAIRDYDERKRIVEGQASEKARTVEEQNKVWRSRQERYVNLKQEHSFKDFTYAEELVTDTFSQTQQGIIVQGAEDPALLVYALGKNPKKLEELSKIKDPVEFAFKVAKLESQLKVTGRKAPSPEKRISSGNSGASSDKKLARLEAEAEKSGDRTKVVAYKRSLSA